MPTTTHRVSTASTTNAATYVSGSFTPAAGDLIFVFVTVTGDVGAGSLTDSQGLNFQEVDQEQKNTSVDTTYCFIAIKLAANSAMTVTYATNNGNASGAVIDVYSVSGMSRVGQAAALQIAGLSNQATATPAMSFGNTVQTGNVTLGVISSARNPAAMTPPTSWTEGSDTGYATPTTGEESVFRNSGFTGSTITWGNSTGSAWCGIIIELDASVPSLMSAFSDNFNGPSIDGTKWFTELGGGTITVSGGVLTITTKASTVNDGNTLQSDDSYNLVGSYAMVEVKSVLNGDQATTFTLDIFGDGNNRLYMSQQNGTLTAEKVVNGTFTSVASIAYNATTMKWWRIRESSGTIFYDYSADGKTWTNLGSVTSPFSVISMTVGFETFEATSNATPGSAIFDNFNVFFYTPAWSGLGMNMYSSDTNFANDLADLISLGITNLRIDIPDYENTVALAASKVGVLAAIAAGANVIWGVSSNSFNSANNVITTENWSTFASAVLAAASWAQSNGVFEFSLGNEEELHLFRTPISLVRTSNVVTATFTENHGFTAPNPVNIWFAADNSFNAFPATITVISPTTFTYPSPGANGTLADPTVVQISNIIDDQIEANLKVLATSVQSVFTRGNVSYSCPIGDGTYFIDKWHALGLGDIDIIAFNAYLDNSGVLANIANMIPYFGSSHVYLTEFSLSTTSLASYDSDPNNQAADIKSMMISIISAGITRALFYTWQGNDFGVADDSNNFRPLWASLLNTKVFSMVLTETVTMTDSIIKTTGRILTEVVTMTDTVKKTPGRILSETVTMTDSLLKTAGKMLTETVTMTDVIIRSIGKSLTEIVTMTDTVIKQVGRIFTETVTQTDTFGAVKVKASTFTETVTMSDTMQRVIGAVRTETVTLTDTLKRTLSRVYSETVTLSDTLIKTTGKVLTDTVTLTDSFLVAIGRIFTETVTMSDTLLRTTIRVFTETITLSDTMQRTIGKVLIETVTLTASFTKMVGRIMAETVTMTDVFIYTAARSFFETVTMTDIVSRTVGKVLADTITLTDIVQRAIGRAFTETVTMTDNFHVTFIVLLNEVVTMTDSIKKVLGITFTETVTLIDTVRVSVVQALATGRTILKQTINTTVLGAKNGVTIIKSLLKRTILKDK